MSQEIKHWTKASPINQARTYGARPTFKAQILTTKIGIMEENLQIQNLA